MLVEHDRQVIRSRTLLLELVRTRSQHSGVEWALDERGVFVGLRAH